MTSTVSIRELRVSLRSAQGSATPILNGISFDVAAGERVSLMGPNGAGKTTLLLALVGAVSFEGSIEIDGIAVNKANLDRVRARVGFVFSNPSDQLFCDTVEEEVRFGPKRERLSQEEQERRVSSALSRVGLEHLRARHPAELSLGEQRRLSAACAFALEPSLIVFDEPTASLDPVARKRILETLARTPATLFVATHDLGAARALGSRVLLLSNGTLVADGDAEKLLSDAALLEKSGLGPG